jgi:molybdopterin synthase catalytic subunit
MADTAKRLDLNRLMDSIRQHPGYRRVGMILCHIGIVRATARNGRPVKGLRVVVDHDRLAHVVHAQRQRPGIIDIQVAIAENLDLAVGDDVMLLVVAGDVRENVISVLTDTLEAIKRTVTAKTEFFE